MSVLPNKLKAYELNVQGRGLGRKAKNVTLPKLTRKTEEWRAGSMQAPVEADLGMEALLLEFTTGGAEVELIKHFGARTVDALQLRFSGAYQCDDDNSINALEVVVRGRFKEIDFGAQTSGEMGETKITVPCAYLKYTFNARTIVEIDPLNMTEIVNGEDLLEQVRVALGLASIGASLL